MFAIYWNAWRIEGMSHDVVLMIDRKRAERSPNRSTRR